MKGAIKKAEDIVASMGENAYMLQQYSPKPETHCAAYSAWP